MRKGLQRSRELTRPCSPEMVHPAERRGWTVAVRSWWFGGSKDGSQAAVFGLSAMVRPGCSGGGAPAGVFVGGM